MFTLNICLALNLIILFAVFFFRKNNSLPNKILALLLLDTAISFLGNATIVADYFTDFPYLFFLSWCTSAYFGPLFFTYTCLFTGSRVKLKHPLWLWAFCNTVFGLSFPVTYLLLPVSERADFALSLLNEPLPWQMTVINISGMLTIWVSLIAATTKVIQYKKRLVRTVSNLEKTKLNFIIQFVALGYFLTLISSVLYIILPQYRVEYLYLPCLLTLFYLFIFIYTFRNHAIFSTETYGQFLQDTLPAREELIMDEKQSAPVPQRELEVLAQAIEDYLMRSGIYTNPDLTISTLANGMNSSTEKISAAINKEMNKNFFDLINEKRVDKAKVFLTSKLSQMTIEAIGYEAGFNSRASFYRAFKKCTSLTPSEYLNQSSEPSLRESL